MNRVLFTALAVGAGLAAQLAQAAPAYIFKRSLPALSVQPSSAGAPSQGAGAEQPPAPPSATGVVLQAAGYRTWADGSTATSCLGYLQPSGSYSYEGATGDGLYQITPAGQSATAVYCDMTRDGGGWALVMKAPAGAPNRASWSTTSALYVENLQNPTVLGGAAKHPDAFINALKTQAYKLEGSFPSGAPVRYVKPSCVYAHTSPATGDCLKSYASAAWAGERVGGYGATALGIHDAISPAPGYAHVYFQLNSASSPDWYVGNGTGTSYGYDYRNSAAASFLMWVR